MFIMPLSRAKNHGHLGSTGLGNEPKNLISFTRSPSGGFVLRPEQNITSDLGLWMVIRKNENVNNFLAQKYQIKQGDLLKFGRMLFRIKKLQPNCENDKQPANIRIKQRVGLASCQSDSEKVDLLSFKSDEYEGEAADPDNSRFVPKTNNDEESDDNACRVCYQKVTSPEDPLISMCRCSGSMKYIHYSCVKSWIGLNMVDKKTEYYTSISFKNLKCEICKMDYPRRLAWLTSDKIEHKGRLLSLMEIEEPEGNFIILEMFGNEKETSEHSLKGMFIIRLTESSREATLGRGKNCKVLLSDVSVSRQHCKILLAGDKYYLEDLEAKFGTLVSISQDFVVSPGQNIEIQINQIFLSINLQKISNSQWLCCGQ